MKIRFARPTNDLDRILKFYRDGLGLEVITSFRDHDGFDGVILGLKEMPYHLEFTQKKGEVVPSAPTQENLIVFYLPLKAEFEAAMDRILDCGFSPVSSHNPYWDRGGKTFEDFEGYRVVLFNDEWK